MVLVSRAVAALANEGESGIKSFATSRKAAVPFGKKEEMVYDYAINHTFQ
jgi:hypothetical protein